MDAVSATGPEKGTSASDFPSTALGRLVSDWQEGSRPNLGPDLASLRFGPDTAKPVVVIGDMAEDGFRRDVPKLLEAADAGNIQLEVRLLPTNKAVNPASGFPQLDRWAWGGQATVRIGQLRQDGDTDGEEAVPRFVDGLTTHDGLARLRAVTARPAGSRRVFGVGRSGKHPPAVEFAAAIQRPRSAGVDP